MKVLNTHFERQGEHILPAYNTERGQRRVVEVSRRAFYTSMAALLQTRMNEVIDIAYDQAVHETWINVDPVTKRLLFGVPWATNSHRKWGLYRSECDIMRIAVTTLADHRNGPFFFDEDARRWCLDLEMYPSRDALLAAPHAFTINVNGVIYSDRQRQARIQARNRVAAGIQAGL